MKHCDDVVLPRATSRADNGPILAYSELRLSVRYDYGEDDGSSTWTTLHFRRALAFQFREWTVDSDTSELVDDWAKMPVWQGTVWANQLLARKAELLQLLPENATKSEPYFHYVLQFQDNCVVDVLANGCSIDQTEIVKP